jgi:hypothetical protein
MVGALTHLALVHLTVGEIASISLVGHGAENAGLLSRFQRTSRG